MIDKPITSKLAELLYNVYEVPYLTCLLIQEYEEKAEKLDNANKELKALEILRNSNKQFKEMQIGTGYGLTIYVDVNNEEEYNLLNEVLDIERK